MNHVNPSPSINAGTPLNVLARQQHIENALSSALYLVRQPEITANALQAATAKATRAATLLKHACEEVSHG